MTVVKGRQEELCKQQQAQEHERARSNARSSVVSERPLHPHDADRTVASAVVRGGRDLLLPGIGTPGRSYGSECARVSEIGFGGALCLVGDLLLQHRGPVRGTPPAETLR